MTPEELAKVLAAHSPATDPGRENRRLHYQEAGAWARHYSTVRMTVATFVLTVIVAIIALKSGAAGGDGAASATQVGNAISGLWLVAAAVFYAFTWQTFARLQAQLRHRVRLPTETEDSARPCPIANLRGDGGCWAIAVVSTGFAWFAWTQAGVAIHCGLKVLLALLAVFSVLFPFCGQAALDGDGNDGA